MATALFACKDYKKISGSFSQRTDHKYLEESAALSPNL
jgi:hypothetical protein